MTNRWLGIIALVIPTLLGAQTGRGPYARIAVLRPHDGKTVDFEAGYLRHLEWHRQARDPWMWYGWSIWAGDRYRWFVYATFGHSATSLDSAVTPAEDERDNVLNVAPHVEWVTNGRPLVPARSLPRHRRAATDGSARVHHRGPGARSGKGVRVGTERESVTTAGRDALVPDGGRRTCATLRPAPSPSRSVGGAREERGTGAPRRGQPPDRQTECRRGPGLCGRR